MILSDYDINYELKKGFLNITPSPSVIQPASVDLHLSNDIKLLNGESYNLSEENYTLKPGEFLLGSTLEYVVLPDYLVGIVDGKSSIGRCGVMVHVTAGYIDPGFNGNITLELFNCSDQEFILEEGMSICQLVLERLSSSCMNPYGSSVLGSHYQNSNGTIYSRR